VKSGCAVGVSGLLQSEVSDLILSKLGQSPRISCTFSTLVGIKLGACSSFAASLFAALLCDLRGVLPVGSSGAGRLDVEADTVS